MFHCLSLGLPPSGDMDNGGEFVSRSRDMIQGDQGSFIGMIQCEVPRVQM